MLTFKECLIIARREKQKINHCVEYTNAYMFSYEGEEETIGGETPIVVLKDTGKIMNMAEYIWTPNKEYIGEIRVD